MEKPVENVIDETIKSLRNMLDANTVIGTPIVKKEVTIIPVSKITVGFVTGGGEYDAKKKKHLPFGYPFAGGSGGGANVSPIGFLIINGISVEFLKTDAESNFEKLLEAATEIVKNRG